MSRASDSVPSAPKFRQDRSHYEAALQKWISDRYPEGGDVDITDIEIPVGTGFSNETVLFTASWDGNGDPESNRYVGRIEPADGAMFPVQTEACSLSVLVQHRAMSAVAAAGVVPVPNLVGFEPDATVIGQPFFVMDFVEGRIPTDYPRFTESGFMVDEASPGELGSMVMSGIDAMAGIHSIDASSPSLDWLRPGQALPSQVRQLELYRAYARRELAGREHPVLDAALEWLSDRDPHDERIGLSWGDARISNIIWQDYQPAAVLDWEGCAVCPTEADVGWWLMFDRMSFDDVGVERLAGYPTRDEMISRYEQVSERAVRDPRYWEVFGVMRFSAIFIRLADRMVAAGLIPAERNPAVGNFATETLAELIGVPNPTPDLLGRY